MSLPADTEPLPPSGAVTRLPSLGAPELSTEYLRRVKEILEAMLGRRGGNDWDRVVTFRDLHQMGLQPAAGGAMLFASGTAPVFDSSAPGHAQFMGSLEAAIRNSAAFKTLMTRIGSAEDLAQYPEEIRRSLSTAMAQVARERQAAIVTVEERVQSLKLSMASRLEEITAGLERTSAGIRKFDVAYADRTQAIALQVTQLAASMEGIGSVELEERFLAIANEIDGLQGQWSIKIQANGDPANPVIAGIALSVEDPIAGPGTSSLIFMAEKFGFVTQNGNAIPFSIVGDQIEFNGNVRINGQLVIDAGGLRPGFEAPGTKNSEIVIGGRNFARNSRAIVDLPNNTGLGTSVARNDEAIPYFRINAATSVSTFTDWIVLTGVPAGTVCTISTEVRIGSAGTVSRYAGQGVASVPANTWTRISFQFIYDGAGVRGGHTYSGTVLDYRNYKVEIGNKATDWTPAPEDVAADAQEKADAAQSAAGAYALAQADLARVTAEAYADGIVDAEEARAIADATNKAEAARVAAVDAAAIDAQAKANAAAVLAVNAAAIAAQTKADLAETTAKAYADGIVTTEEARAIADATAKANAAQAAAIAAAALDATAKANAAQAAAADDATAKAAYKLNKNAADVLNGPVALQTNGALITGTLTTDANGYRTGGYGAAFTSRGIVAYNTSGVITFLLDYAGGNPYFAGQLSAAYGTFGSVSIAADGAMQVGDRTYGGGNGVWFGFDGGVAKFAVGSPTQYIRWNGTNLEEKREQIVLGALSAVSSMSGGNGSRLYGTRTLSVTSGGTAPFAYEWYFSYAERLTLANTDTATVSIYGHATDDITGGRLVGRVTDANGLSATVSCNVNGQHGTVV